MDRGAWQATVHGVTKRQTELSDSAHTHNLGFNRLTFKFTFILLNLAYRFYRNVTHFKINFKFVSL